MGDIGGPLTKTTVTLLLEGRVKVRLEGGDVQLQSLKYEMENLERATGLKIVNLQIHEEP